MCEEAGYELDEQFIRGKIANKLPEYMIPKTYHKVVNMALNKNGKV